MTGGSPVHLEFIIHVFDNSDCYSTYSTHPVIHDICYKFSAPSAHRLNQRRLFVGGLGRRVGGAAAPVRAARREVELVVPVAVELRIGHLRAAAALRLLVLLRRLLQRPGRTARRLVTARVGEHVLSVDVAPGLGARRGLGDLRAGEDARLLGDRLAHVRERGLDPRELDLALEDDLEQVVVLGDLRLVVARRGGEADEALLDINSDAIRSCTIRRAVRGR